MCDQSKTEAELRGELGRLRRRICELEHAEQAVHRPDEMWRSLVENAADIIAVVTADGTISYVNHTASGIAPQDTVGTSIYDYVPAEHHIRLKESLHRVFETGQTDCFEVVGISRNNTASWYECRVGPVRRGDQVVAAAFVAADITDRKQIEDNLQRNEQKYRALISNIPDVTWTSDYEGNTTFISSNIEAVYGYTPREIYERGDDLWFGRIHPDDLAGVQHAYEALFRSNTQFDVEYRIRKKDGQWIWVHDRSIATYEEGGVLYADGILSDVTARKRAEEEIRRFKTVADKAGHGVAMSDVEGNLTYVNESFAQMHGYRPDELVGRHLSIFHNQEQLECVRRLNRRLVQEGGYVAEEVWHTRKDNTIFPTLMSATVVKDKKGEPLFLAATAIDVTERKEAEEALRQSEEKFRLAMETTNDALWDWDMVTNEVYRSPRHDAMLGYKPGELAASQEEWEKRIHPDDRAFVFDAGSRHLEGKTDSINVEYRLATKSGDYIWVLGRGKVVAYGDDGSPVRMIGTNIDITERRQAEQALCDSEEKYRTLVESAGETIATIDINGVFTFMNETAAKRLGGAPGDFLGKTMWDLFPKDIADRQAANIKKVMKTGRGANLTELTNVRGHLRWYNTTIEPLRNSTGEIRAAMIVARDIHELMQAQERVRHLSSAVEQSIDGVAMGDVQSQLLYVNDAFARMHGYTREEMVGMKASNLYAPDQIDRYEAVFAQIREEGSYAGEIWHARKDGTIFPCYISVTLVRNSMGEVTGTVAVCRDMAEFKQKEAELTKFRAQMARAEQLASLGTLSATVAHQITQPLTVIRLSLDNVLDELMGASCSSATIRRLQDSIGQVSNITSIINRFRHFARQSSDTRFGQVSLYATAERVLRLLEESARQARVALRLENMEKLPCVSVNETDLEQLFFALLENAIQAADGTRARRVVIGGWLSEGQVELRFSDTCGGIVPEDLGRIFEPFFTTKPKGHGTGLGLCIAQDIIARMGGRIRVESELGKGTTFFVTLPAKESKAL